MEEIREKLANMKKCLDMRKTFLSSTIIHRLDMAIARGAMTISHLNKPLDPIAQKCYPIMVRGNPPQ